MKHRWSENINLATASHSSKCVGCAAIFWSQRRMQTNCVFEYVLSSVCISSILFQGFPSENGPMAVSTVGLINNWYKYIQRGCELLSFQSFFFNKKNVIILRFSFLQIKSYRQNPDFLTYSIRILETSLVAFF